MRTRITGVPPYANTCQGCGDRLYPTDDVRALHRESAVPREGDEATYPIVAYSHLGHEPQAGYRITGRGPLRDLTEGAPL